MRSPESASIGKIETINGKFTRRRCTLKLPTTQLNCSAGLANTMLIANDVIISAKVKVVNIGGDKEIGRSVRRSVCVCVYTMTHHHLHMS